MALYESVFSLLEGSLPEYGEFGVIRQPSGSAIPTAAPSNTYRCADGLWLAIGANGDKIFKRLCQVINRPELALTEEYDSNPKRVANAPMLDNLIENWTLTQNAEDAEKLLLANDIPAGRLFNIEDCAKDPHYIARDMIMQVKDPRFGEVTHPGVVPKFIGQKPGVNWPGSAVGAHNREIYTNLLDLSEQQLTNYKEQGVI